jgi:hypothetical protein
MEADICAPKAPKVEPVVQRIAARLPDNGDPAVRESARRRRLSFGALMTRAKSTLGAPALAQPSTGGY